MAYLNKVEIIGNVGNSELIYSQAGKPILKFSIAVWQKDKNGEKQPSIWFKCSLFGDRAEKMKIEKGATVFVSGSISLNTFTTKDNKQLSEMQVMVDNVQTFSKPVTTSENFNIPGEETF